MPGDIASNGMVGLENVLAALGCVEFTKNFFSDHILITGFPYLHIAVTADTQTQAILFAKFYRIEIGLGLQRIHRIDTYLYIVVQYFVYITAAVVYNHQSL